MGGDGGQVIDRATMVKTKGWGLTKGSGNRFAASLGEMANYVQMTFEDRGLGPLESHRTKMTQCFLSQETLRDPVVACRLGNLYNKEAMIGALLNRSIPQGLHHIKKLSDLKNCVVTWKEDETEDGKKHMVCPISRNEIDSGGSRAVLIWSTGVVLGLKSLNELKMKECPVTGKPFDSEKDVFKLAPDSEELAKLVERLPAAKKKKELGARHAESAPVEAYEAALASSTKRVNSSGKAKEQALLDGEVDEQGNLKKAKTDKTPNNLKPSEKGSDLWKSLFCTDREGLSGPRDGFGKPYFNRGSAIGSGGQS